jgi:hypothetical protein
MFPPNQRGFWLLFRIDPLRRIQTGDRFERPEPSEQAEWIVSLRVRNRRGFPPHLRELLKTVIERDQILLTCGGDKTCGASMTTARLQDRALWAPSKTKVLKPKIFGDRS